MKCPRCGKDALLIEGLGEGKTRVSCQSCGFQEIKDDKGRGLLTDDMPRKDQRHLIMS